MESNNGEYNKERFYNKASFLLKKIGYFRRKTKETKIIKATGENGNILQHISSVFFALLVCVFLLAFPSAGYAAIAEFKYKLFLLLCGGYSAAMIIINGWSALTATQPAVKMFKQPGGVPAESILLFLFLFFTVLSAILAEYAGTFTGAFRREGLLTIVIYVLCCFFLAKYLRPGKWMLLTLGYSTCLFCLLAFIQLSGANPFLLYPQGYNYYDAGIYYSGEYLGTIGNAGLCAAFLSIISGVFSMSLIKFDFKERWFLAFPLFIAVLLLFKMNVNAGIVALAAGFVIMLPVAVTNQAGLAGMFFVIAVTTTAYVFSETIVFRNGGAAFTGLPLTFLFVAVLAALLAVTVLKNAVFAKIPALYYRIGSTAIACTVIILIIICLWFYNGENSGMIYEASEALHGRWADSFGSSRIYIWRNVWSGIGKNLLFGTGPDTLGFWDIAPFTRYSKELDIMLTSRIDAAHNEYLHTLACTGLFSLLCYLGVLFYTAVKWFRSPDNSLAAVAGAGVLFYCIQAVFGVSMYITAPFFWSSFAVLIHALHRAAKQDLGFRM